MAVAAQAVQTSSSLQTVGQAPPLEKFPTVSDLNDPEEDAAATGQAPTFSSLEVGADPAGTVALEGGPTGSPSGEEDTALPSSSTAPWSALPTADASLPCKPEPEDTSSSTTALPTADASLPRKPTQEDLDSTLDATQPLDAVQPPPVAASQEDDLDDTVHIQRVVVQEDLDATTELKLGVGSSSACQNPAGSPSDRPDQQPSTQDWGAASAPPGTGASEPPANESFIELTTAAPANKRSDPFLVRPASAEKATTSIRPRPRSPSSENLLFCSNRKENGGEQFSLSAVLQNFFICFARQGG